MSPDSFGSSGTSSPVRSISPEESSIESSAGSHSQLIRRATEWASRRRSRSCSSRLTSRTTQRKPGSSSPRIDASIRTGKRSPSRRMKVSSWCPASPPSAVRKASAVHLDRLGRPERPRRSGSLQLLRGKARDLAEALVHLRDPPLSIHHPDPVAKRGEEGAGVALALDQPSLGRHPRREVRGGQAAARGLEMAGPKEPAIVPAAGPAAHGHGVEAPRMPRGLQRSGPGEHVLVVKKVEWARVKELVRPVSPSTRSHAGFTALRRPSASTTPSRSPERVHQVSRSGALAGVAPSGVERLPSEASVLCIDIFPVQ